MREIKLVSEDIKEFWKRLKTGPEDVCWEWQGGFNGDGYGCFKGIRAHRISQWLVDGLNDKMVLHHCGNRLCCNPSHLYRGNHRQNMVDMTTAGSHDGFNRKGGKHPRSILTDKDARYIKQSLEPGVILSARYQVSASTVSSIRHGTRWKHI